MRRATILLAIAALVAAPATVLAAEQFTATLTPGAEVPPVTCEADCSGSASVTISDDETSIDYEVTFENLSDENTPSAAHIHFGGADVSGPVMIPFEVGPSPFSGTFNEADYVAEDGIPATWAEALDAIRDGDAYVNVHTATNPGGEIRGQLDALPDTAAPGAETSSLLSTPLILLALVGLAAFIFAIRTLAFRRA